MLKVWIHAVWSTKKRMPVLTRAVRQELFEHMMSVGRSKGFLIDRLNGYNDHVHVLFALRSTQCVADIVNHLKGASSRYINRNKLTYSTFEWQSDYYACSVSDIGLKNVQDYIDNQEAHHQSIPFKTELMDLTSGED
jgi:putative transposase